MFYYFINRITKEKAIKKKFENSESMDCRLPKSFPVTKNDKILMIVNT